MDAGLTESLAVGGPKMDGSVKIAWLIGYSWEFYYVLLPKLLGIVRTQRGSQKNPTSGYPRNEMGWGVFLIGLC